MSPTLVAIAIFVVVGAVHVLLPRFLMNQNRRQLAAICRQQRAVVITFDDGPGRLLTPLVVRRLAEANVAATFFLLGNNVRGNEDIVDDIARQGHEIGSHGDQHVHHVWSWPWAGLLDTRAAWRRLHDLTGLDAPRIPFRPPYGKLNLLSLLWGYWHGTPLALWTHDSYDTRLGVELRPEALADSVRQAGGGVVLLHDFDRSIPNADKQVLAKLEAVLRLREEGFRFLRVGDLLGITARG
jgi:peptidoglycan-N-acetylglucosamine deacetylase